MPPRDFRASQLQTNKIIADNTVNGTVTNARLLVYPIAAQDTGNPNQGFINTSVFGLNGIGTDVFLYVSGAIGQRGLSTNAISVFGGDLHVSGNLSLGGTFPAITLGGDVVGLSTSNTVDKLQTYTLNLTGLSTNDVIRYNGTQLVRSTAPLGNQFVEGTPSPRLRTTASLAIDSLGRFAHAIGTDTYFFVSGSINSRGTSERGTSTFGGDVHVSGNLSIDGALISDQFRMNFLDYTVTSNTSSNPEVVAQVVFPGNEYAGTLELRGVMSTTNPAAEARIRLWNLTAATYVEIGGPGIIELATNNLTPTLLTSVDLMQAVGFSTISQAIYELHLYTTNALYDVYAGGWEFRPLGTFSLGTQAIKQWIEGAPSPRIRTTGSVGIGSDSVFAEDAGTDVFFFVSGTQHDRGTANSKTAVVSGDFVISGSVFGGIANTIFASRNSVLLGSDNNTIQYALGSSILSGRNNSIITTSTGSFIGGGSSNFISSSDTAASATTTNNGSFIVGGRGNTIINKGNSTSPLSILGGTGNYIGIGGMAAILGGFNNKITSSVATTSVETHGVGSVIVGGSTNTISASLNASLQASYGFIGAGESNLLLNHNHNFIGAGFTNSIQYDFTAGGAGRHFIGAGNNNKIQLASSGSAIVAGAFNTISGTAVSPSIAGISFIGAGVGNTIESSTTTANGNSIVAGAYNTISASHLSSIATGQRNLIGRQSSSTIGGGTDNIVTNTGNTTIINPGNQFIGAGGENEIRVASSGSAIVAGYKNVISSSTSISSRSGISFIGAGQGNQILSDFNTTFGNSIVGGNINLIQHGHLSFIGGGERHIISGSTLTSVTRNFIGGGLQNSIRANPLSSQVLNHNFMGSGQFNTISSSATETSRNAVVAGENNIIFDTVSSFIGSGRLNRLSGADDGIIVGGRNNLISGSTANFNDDQIIVGGYSNAISSSVPSDMYRNFIGGGENNQIRSTGTATHNNAILGGRNNTLADCTDSVVIGSNTEGSLVSQGIFLGGGIYNNSRVSTVNGNITLLDNDMIINVTINSSASFTISAPPFGRVGRVIIVSNSTGTSKTINTVSMASGVTRMFYYDGASWRVIG